jgi:hypothetical protein
MEGTVTEPFHEQASSFSLLQGGLFHRVGWWLRFDRSRRLGLLAVVAVAVAFVPLVVLAALQDVLHGNRVTLPLLSDWSALVRFGLAIPLLILAERTIDRRLSTSVGLFRALGISGGESGPRFESALADLARWRDSVLPELILLAIAIGSAWVSSHLAPDISSWRVLTPGIESSVTMADRWMTFVSLPIFRFLVLLWFWRILLWSRFLYRVSRMDLDLIPTHPDGAAGLGFLGIAQMSFAALLVPLALTVGARGVFWVQYGGGTFDALKYSLLLFVVIALALTLGPLLVFLPKLAAVKRRGLAEYAILASQYTRRFDQKWVHGRPPDEEPLLGSADIQSLADLGNSYGAIQGMRLIPATLGNALALVLAAVVPLLPSVAALVPLEQILRLLLQLLA